MSSLKHHLSLILPLLALLFSLESMVLIQRAVEGYEVNLGKNYSIVIASKRALTLEELKPRLKELELLQVIDPEGVLAGLKKELDPASLGAVKESLPRFYSLSLRTFPNQARLQAIESTLRQIEGVERVEAFAKSHDQIYRLLLLFKSSVRVFAALILVISLLLMIKQVEIWRFEHSERMEIMGYFGAPSWMRHGLLFRLAVVDSLLSVLVIIAGLLYLSRDGATLLFLRSVGLDESIFSFQDDALRLLGSGILVSVLAVWLVIWRQRD